MSTKNAPGKFDCYANAEPDEPMFVLLGRDPMAPMLVEQWGHMRVAAGEDPAKVAEADECARQMRAWLAKIGKRPASVLGTQVIADIGHPEVKE
jgi:hypothetical protein